MSATRGQGNEAQALRQFGTFEKFSDSELEQIFAASHHSSHTAPWPLIHEQTPSDACFILLSGEAGVYVGKERVAVVGAGEVIGESALRQGQLRNATVTTTGPADVLRIERADLARLLEEIPALRELINVTAASHQPD